MDGRDVKPRKCQICTQYESLHIYKHYVLKHFWDELKEELDDFFPRGYDECLKCDNYTHDTLDDAVYHIGVAHKRVDDYLRDWENANAFEDDSDTSDDIGMNGF